MSIAHRLSLVALAVALVALRPTQGCAQEQQSAASQPAPAMPPVVPISADEQRRFLGDYDISLPDGRIMGVRVFVEEGQLMIAPEDQEKAPMRHLGSNTFGLDFDPTLRITFDVAGGKVTGGKLVQHGTSMNILRRP